MIKKIFLLLFPLLVISCTSQAVSAQKLFVQADNGVVEFNVEIAETPQELATGLMNRKGILDNQGMLFVFPKPDKLTFWMKNTYVPLDMIFMDKDMKIVKIEKSAQPCKTVKDTDCPLFKASEAQYVLEIKGGLSELKGFKAGDSISLSSQND